MSTLEIYFRFIRQNLAFYFVSFAILVPAATYSQPPERICDGFESIVGMQRKVYDVVEVNRTPLFENAPFLRLKKGDKLVRAKEDMSDGKGKSAGNGQAWYYLLSEGKYYQLWTEEEEGKLLLSPAFCGAQYCLCFDWDFSMANARALHEIWPYNKTISPAQYLVLYRLVKEEFPEAVVVVRGMPASTDITEDRIVSFSGHLFAEFQGIACVGDTIYKYIIRIGPGVFSIHGLPLIRGPKYVARDEFEEGHYGGINGRDPYHIDPEKAKIKKAEYDRMVRFRELIRSVLYPKAPGLN
jgi:hypothetical protein